MLAERILLTLLASGKIPAEMIRSEDFETEANRQTAQWLISGKSAALLAESIDDDEARNAVVQAVNYSPIPEEREDIMALAHNSLDTIRRSRLEKRMREIQEKINTADSAQKMEMYTQMAEITQALEELTGRKES